MSALSAQQAAAYQRFLEAAVNAPNETSLREAFVTLAATAFSDSNFASELALGAEYSMSFRRGGLIRRGRVDSFIDNVLVEFKLNLARAADGAIEQLRSYVAGAWAEDDSYNRSYLGVVTDGSHWRVFAAAPVNPDASSEAENVALVQVDAWELPVAEEDAVSSLDQFLNRVFFRQTLLQPTATNFARDFGVESPAFVAVGERLRRAMRELGGEPQMQTHRAAWAEDIRVSYGGDDTPAELFVRHTYLALLTRLLVFAALEHRPLRDGESEAILDGTYFVGRRIGNLVEDDYFQWPLLASKSQLRETWGALVAQLATYDLKSVREDVLKPLYEQLVDAATRHDLGEYYTPDWLAEEVVEAALQPWLARETSPSVLDPTCGSGSFLRAAIHHLRLASEHVDGPLLDQLLHSVVGMDVNPLAVTVAKATYLLAIADLIPHAEDVVHLPVYLCNSLSAQERSDTASLFGDQVDVVIGDRNFALPLDLVRHGPDFDEAIEAVVAVARSFAPTSQPASAAAQGVRARVEAISDRYLYRELLEDSLAAMCVHLVELIRVGRDTIHGFLLRNKYRSVLLYAQFDVVVGNPPWLTVADITSPDYRDLLLRRVAETKIAGRSAGDQAHSELATLFLAQVCRQFLSERKPSYDLPRIAFVMPRSVFTATHHRPLREGTYRPAFDIEEIWDLADVEPLFNVPSCVLIATSGKARPNRVKRGRIYRGRLSSRDPDPSFARDRLDFTETEFVLGRLGKRTAWQPKDENVATKGTAGSPYQARFRQGAILYPQTLLSVRTSGAVGRGAGDVAVETDPAVRGAAKVLADVELHGVVERSSLFSTAAAEHLLPYALAPALWTVVLPVLADPGQPEFASVDPDTLRRHGRIGTADWYDRAEEKWKASQTKPSLPLWQRLDHLGHLSAQAHRSRWIVLYTSAGSRPVAALVDSTSTPYPFVARDQTYWASFADQDEALFVSACLNSDEAAARIKAFMTTGLFGPRHIHKRVLDVPVPTFDSANPVHAQLVATSRALTKQAGDFAAGIDTRANRARRSVREALSDADLSEVERLVRVVLADPGGT